VAFYRNDLLLYSFYRVNLKCRPSKVLGDKAARRTNLNEFDRVLRTFVRRKTLVVTVEIYQSKAHPRHVYVQSQQDDDIIAHTARRVDHRVRTCCACAGFDFQWAGRSVAKRRTRIRAAALHPSHESAGPGRTGRQAVTG